MSKSTKVIAALGVAAGLGIAALPAATFAEAQYTNNVVPLKVIINDTLSLAGVTTGDFASTEGLTLAAGQNDSTSKTVWTAISNDTDGWTVSVAPTDTGTNILSNGVAADDISPFTSEVTDLSTNTTSGWGIKLNNLAQAVSATGSHFTTSGFTGVTTGPDQVVTSSTTSGTAGQTFETIYGIDLADDQAAGTYSGSITFTIAGNPTPQP